MKVMKTRKKEISYKIAAEDNWDKWAKKVAKVSISILSSPGKADILAWTEYSRRGMNLSVSLSLEQRKCIIPQT